MVDWKSIQANFTRMKNTIIFVHGFSGMDARFTTAYLNIPEAEALHRFTESGHPYSFSEVIEFDSEFNVRVNLFGTIVFQNTGM
ncbi:hypothetical protein GCM10028809_55820 [Spirosoma gilvum]